jgi:hypothetical protein
MLGLGLDNAGFRDGVNTVDLSLLKVYLAASWQIDQAVRRIASRKVGRQNTRHLRRPTRDVARVGRHAFALGVLRRSEFRPA